MLVTSPKCLIIVSLKLKNHAPFDHLTFFYASSLVTDMVRIACGLLAVHICEQYTVSGTASGYFFKTQSTCTLKDV